MRLKLVLEYDGAAFHGWQLQRSSGRRTVQGVLSAALAELPGRWSEVQGAGRTDAGAHAEGQVVSLTYTGKIPIERVRAAVNAKLPADVAVLSAHRVPDAFHARYSAIARHYRYRFQDRPVRPVLDRGRAWWSPFPLDEAAMGRAVPALLGRHDWTALCSATQPVSDRERDLFDAVVIRRGQFVDLDLVGEGFLRGLVRGIAGAVIEVGLGRRGPEWLGQLVLSRERARAPRTAPAHGLTLVEVRYPGDA